MFSQYFHSFVLAQIFGLYLIIMAIILLSRVKFYRGVIKGMSSQGEGLFVASSIGLLLGLFLVVIHNIWVVEPRVLVTIIAWLILIKSILWLAFPSEMMAWSKRSAAGSGYYVMIGIMAVIGILLLTKGFYHFI